MSISVSNRDTESEEIMCRAECFASEKLKVIQLKSQVNVAVKRLRGSGSDIIGYHFLKYGLLLLVLISSQ